MNRFARHAGVVATVLFFATLFGFGAARQGYSQARHPVALLGAEGAPSALAFNLLGLIVPGLLAIAIAIGLRTRLHEGSGWTARIGTQLTLLSGLAFAAQGLLPLVPSNLDATINRLHAAAWMSWWIAFVAGAALIAFGVRALAWFSLLAAGAVLWFALFAPDVLDPGLTQRVAFAAWFGWLIIAARVPARSGKDHEVAQPTP